MIGLPVGRVSGKIGLNRFLQLDFQGGGQIDGIGFGAQVGRASDESAGVGMDIARCFTLDICHRCPTNRMRRLSGESVNGYCDIEISK